MPAASPTILIEPFANSAPNCSAASPTPGGKTNPFPVVSQILVTNGAASLTDGFPANTMRPIASGGTWPFGQDANGILFAVTNNIVALTGGQFYTYNPAWAAANTGYEVGALLAMVSGAGFWLNQTSGNTSNPDTGGAGWAAFSPWTQLSLGEIAHTITPVNTLYPPGHAWRYGMKADNGMTDNSVPLNNLLLASAGYCQAFIPASGPGNTYQLTKVAHAPAGSDIYLEQGATLQWTACSSPSYNLLGSACTAALSVDGFPFKISGGGAMLGPTATNSYTLNECGIIALGPNAGWNNAPTYGGPFTVDSIKITNFGAYGIIGQYLTDVGIFNNEIFNVGYACLSFLTCRKGSVTRNNRIHDAYPGSGGNVYGINLSHDATGATQFAVQGGSASTYYYSNDTHLTTSPPVQQQCTNAFCIDWTVEGNTFYNFPLWAAIECHGGFGVRIIGNRVHNSYIPIQCSIELRRRRELCGRWKLRHRQFDRLQSDRRQPIDDRDVSRLFAWHHSQRRRSNSAYRYRMHREYDQGRQRNIRQHRRHGRHHRLDVRYRGDVCQSRRHFW